MVTARNLIKIRPPEDFVPIPQSFSETSLPALFERAVEMYPENVAVTAQGQRITYQELNNRANLLAQLILDRCGSGREPVALLLGHDLGAVIGLLGVLKSGKPYLPLNTLYPAERVRKIVADAHVLLLITDSANLAVAEKALQEENPVSLLDLDHADFSPRCANLAIRIDPNQAAFIMYTSGSTGEPKGVISSHRHVAITNIAEVNEWQVSPSDRISMFGSISFGLSRSTLYDSLFSGATVCMYDVKNGAANQIIEWMQTEGVTIIRSPEPLFRLIFSETPVGLVFSGIRLIGLGGQSIKTHDIALFRAHTPSGCIFMNVFYSTEAGGVSRYYLDHSAALPGEFVPIGYPWPDKQVILVDEDGRTVARGARGEMVIISKNLSSGYFNNPALTAGRFQADPHDPQTKILHTGDFARLNDMGALEFLGREDSFVKIRGYSVELSEIEAVLYQTPLVKDAVVLARPSRHEPDLNQLIAYVVLIPGVRTSVQELRLIWAEKLPDYMVPPFVAFLAELPLNANGKVDRRALPELPERQELLEKDLPADDVEAGLVQIWKKVFNLERIGVNDNFFDLGGDSLLAISLFLYVERSFSRQFSSSILLQHPTIQSLASLLRKTQGDNSSAVIPVQPLGGKTPLFWIPSGFGVDLYVQGMAKHFDPDRPLYLLASPKAPADQLFLIEELARNYAREILQFFPQGPYYLVGHSNGGLIACETGRELARSGADVRWVGVLDSAPPNMPSTTIGEVLRLFVQNIAVLGFSRSAKDFGRNLFVNAAMFALGPQWMRARILKSRKIPLVNRLGVRQAAYVNAYLANRFYHPAPFLFDVIVFRATGARRYRLEDPTKQWQRFAAGGLKFLDLPGDHVSIMEEPGIGVLAQTLCRQIADS